LREALVELAGVFESTHPGAKLIYNLSASGYLAQQIDNGAPIDVFISADTEQMDRLVKKGLMRPGSVREMARNRLVAVFPAKSKPIKTFTDLLQAQEIVAGNPATVPAGTYAKQAMTHAGVWDKLMSGQRIVFADSVRQALDYVSQSDVDAGFVYVTDAKVNKSVSVGFMVPEDFTEPIIYQMALVRESKHLQLGETFIEFLRSSAAKKVLAAKGFIVSSP
jgi:molybdate transport system substrate-binding protein